MGWLFVVFLFNVLVPTKWFTMFGVPAGEFITLIIYSLFAAKVYLEFLFDPTRHFRNSLSKLWLGCLIVVAISASLSFLEGRNPTYWFWIMKQVIHYLFVFPLVSLVRTRDQYAKCLKYYLVTALLAAGLLHLYAQFPQIADHDLGTGFAHISGGSQRVYTLGALYVFLAAVGLLPFLGRNVLLVAAWLFLLSGLVPTSARFYFGAMAICVTLYLGRAVMVNPRQSGRVAGVLLALLLVFLTVEFAPQEIFAGLKERMQTLAGLGAVPLRDFDTMGWRIRDAETAVAQVRTPGEMVAGVFAKPYVSEGVLSNSVHFGWVGLYFHFGLLGVLVFGALSFLISVKVLSLLLATKKKTSSLPTEWAVGFGLVWVALCLFGFVGGMFVSGPAIIALTLLWYGISLAEKPLSIETRGQEPRGIEWRTALDHNRHPVLQPGSLYRGGPAQRKGAGLPPGPTHRR